MSSISSTTTKSYFPTSTIQLFTLLFFTRTFQSYCLTTYLHPDEYWQSSEIAHNIVYGYGYVTWEWQNYSKIRGFIHPLLIALLYKIVNILGLDNQYIVEIIPKIIFIFIAVITDYIVYRSANRFFNENIARLALLCNLFSFFISHCILRAFSNSIETMFSMIAIYYWSFPQYRNPKTYVFSSRVWSLIFAALAFSFRPTSVLRWLVMGLYLLYTTNDKVVLIFLEVLPVAFVTVIANLSIDRYFYGEWTIVVLNFLKFNSESSDIYGVSPLLWYFTEGLPSMLISYLPLFIAGLYINLKQSNKQLPIALIIFAEMLFYTANGHKEHRFILPILPLCMMFVASAIYYYSSIYGSTLVNYFVTDHIHAKSKSRFNLFSFLLIIIFAVQIGVFYYCGIWYQRATITTSKYLVEYLPKVIESKSLEIIPTDNLIYSASQPFLVYMKSRINWKEVAPGVSGTIMESFIYSRPEASPLGSYQFDDNRQRNPLEVMTLFQFKALSNLLTNSPALYHSISNRPFAVHYLMGCHSTRYYASMHTSYFIPMRMLDCSPPMYKDKVVRGPRTTETKAFLDDPISFVNRFYRDPTTYKSTGSIPSKDSMEAHIDEQEWLPTHIVIFDEHANLIKDWLLKYNYIEVERFFHSFDKWERYMVVYSSI